MRERVLTGLATLALLLGIVHCGLALSFPSFTIDLLWFIGSGAAIVCVALSNLLRSKTASLASSLNLTVQNAVMTSFFGAAWFVLPAPQVAVGAAIFAVLSALSITIMTGPRPELSGTRARAAR